MKKILSLIALLVILSMSLIACSSQEVPVEQPVAVTAEETYGPPVPEELAETSIEDIEPVETVG